MSTTFNATCEQYRTYRMALTYTDDAGDVVDLTGYTAKLAVRKIPSSDYPLIEVNAVVGDELGTLVFEIDEDDTATIPAGKWVYDVKLTDDTGFSSTLIKGKFIVSRVVAQ